jgi:hypothetical protein
MSQKPTIKAEEPQVIGEQGGLLLYRYPDSAPFFMPWLFNGRAGGDLVGATKGMDDETENAS